MLVHLHLPDPVYGVDATCSECDTPLPVGVVAFKQRWHVGQVCLRCRRAAWTLGTYDTPDAAQRALADFVRGRLDRL
jgi:hypothetical protein